MFKKCLLIFLRRIPIISISIFQIAYIFYQIYYQLTNYNSPVGYVLWFLDVQQTFCAPIFIFTLFISYEYIYAFKKCDIEESISCNTQGKLKLYLYPCIVLIIKSFLIFLIMLSFPVAIAVMGNDPMELIWHIVSVSVVNTLLTQIFASVLGLLLAIKFKRLLSYVFMSIVTFLVLSSSSEFFFILYNTFNINLWPIYNLIGQVLPDTTLYGVEAQYGIVNEFFRWNLIIFWISILIALVLVLVLNRRKKSSLIAICVALAFSLGNLYFYSLGNSTIDLSFSPTGTFNESDRYYLYNEPKSEDAEFEISAYDMDFNFDRILYATVTMDITSQNKLDEYIFTLYNKYKISNIQDESGNSLEYIRDGDYLTVKTEKEIQSISLTYSGYSAMFYSNEQGVTLPGCFPYYPWAGFHQIHNTPPQMGFIAKTDFPMTDFTVRLSGSKHLFTNLEEKNGILYGHTDALSIMGGFLEKPNTWEYDVVLESFQRDSTRPNEAFFNSLQQRITELEEEYDIENRINLKDYRIYGANQTIVNRAGYDLLQIFDNHIFMLASEYYIDELAQKIIYEISGITPTEQAHYDPYNLNTTGG